MKTVPEPAGPGPAALAQTYSPEDLSRIFRVGRGTILLWRKNGTIPPGRRYGHRTLRWVADDFGPLLARRGEG